MQSLEEKFKKEITPQLMKELGVKNTLAVPRIKKVIVNIGIKEGASDKAAFESASQSLAVITGQKPRTARARKSVAAFKLRVGDPIGLVVTLRRRRMYDFLEKLFRIVLPRVRDFQGLATKGFDGQGNYTLGIPEQTVFPEVDYAKIDKVRGLEITIVTNTDSDEQVKRLLELLGMPFKKG